MSDWIKLARGTYPPEKVGVLVCFDSGRRAMRWHDNGHWVEYCLRHDDEVTHWLPLPMPQSTAWISLETDLFPPERMQVLVLDNCGVASLGHHHHGFWRGLDGGFDEATHWMPLPKPPVGLVIEKRAAVIWDLIYPSVAMVCFFGAVIAIIVNMPA